MKYKPFFLFTLTCFLSFILIDSFNVVKKVLHNQYHNTITEEIKILDLDGKDFMDILAKPKAKPTLLMLYASWCRNCIVKFAELKNIIREYTDQINYIIISLDEDKQKLHTFLLKQNGIDFIPYNVQQHHLAEIIHVLQNKNLYFNRRVPYIAILDQEMLPVAQELDIYQVRNYIENLLNEYGNEQRL